MTSTVTPSATAAAAPELPSAGVRAAALQAQVQSYEKELSECVNCSSAKTPEGKANIDDISSKLSVVKTRLEQVTPPPKEAPVTTDTNRPGPQNGNWISTSGSLINTTS
jgi:hypothetical protein